MLQVRRPAFIELTMLSRYEARVRFDAFFNTAIQWDACVCAFLFFLFLFPAALRSSAKELLTDFFIN